MIKKLRARLREATHRYSFFGKVEEKAQGRLRALNAEVEKLRPEVARRKNIVDDLVVELGSHSGSLDLEMAEQEHSLKAAELARKMRKRDAWLKRQRWAADRHEQWGNVLRRRRNAVQRWLRIHRTYGAGGWAPTSFWVPQRIDQGQDFEIKLGRRVRAPGDGEVIEWGHDGPFPNGFGDPYAVVRIDTGPFAGQSYYIGHANEAVPRVGLKFREGDLLSRANNSLHAGLGWIELGLWPPGGSTNGSLIASHFREVRG